MRTRAKFLRSVAMTHSSATICPASTSALAANYANMARRAVSENVAVTGDDRKAERPGRRDQDAVGWIAVKRTRQGPSIECRFRFKWRSGNRGPFQKVMKPSFRVREQLKSPLRCQ